MPLKRAGAAVALVLAGGPATPQAPPLQIEHTPPGCLVADKAPRLVACVVPRSTRAEVRALFRADDGPWYRTVLRYEMPCYRGALPRPSAGTPRVAYVVEAQAAGVTARSAEYVVAVAADGAACRGPAAPIATGPRPSWEAPPGAPRTPPGFEGTRLREADGRAASTGDAAIAGARAPAPRKSPAPEPARRSSAPERAPERGGHGLRNAAIVLGGVAAAGGAAVAIRSATEEGPPPTTTGSGLPASGVAGTYVGTESIVYGGGCTGTDDVVLNLQQSASALSGVLAFTVRSCPCCAMGRGANPVSGFLSDTRVELTTPSGFAYSGTFAGNRLSGSLTGPGGVTGTWTVDKR